MCVIALSFDPTRANNQLVVIANRDEYYARPSKDAHWWYTEEEQTSNILGGRDCRYGGTWLAVNHSGRFAAVTNYNFKSDKARASRGSLVADFLNSTLPPMEYLATIQCDLYAGFNLIVYDQVSNTLGYLTNRSDLAKLGPINLPSGVYGVSNGTLDEPWVKTAFLKSSLSEAVQRLDADDEALFSLLTVGNSSVWTADQIRRPSLVSLPSLVPLSGNASSSGSESDFSTYEDLSESEFSIESLFDDDSNDDLPLCKTAPFLFRPSQGYGTRCATVVRCNEYSAWTFVERRFDETGMVVGETTERFFPISRSEEDRVVKVTKSI